MNTASSSAISIGQAFAEIKLSFSDSSTKYDRIYLPRKPLKQYLNQLLEEKQISAQTSIKLCTDWSRTCLLQRTGTQLALMVTSGFEKWPYLRQPDNKAYFQQSPARVDTFLEDDYIFGIEERTHADGSIAKEVNLDELEFLHQKFSLLEIKSVAIGFLNSVANAHNLNLCKNFFEERGYTVVTPDQKIDSFNEVARWWTSVLNVYVSDTFSKQFQDCFSDFEDVKVWASDSFNHFDSQNHFDFLGSSVGKVSSIQKKLHQHELILHLGLEEFLLILPKQKREVWFSKFGPVALPSCQHQRVQIQPNQIIDFQRWDFAELTNQHQNFEVGPTFWGRSMKITVLDILYTLDKLNEIPCLQSLRTKQGEVRFKDTFYSLLESKQFDIQDSTSYFYNLIVNQIASDVVFYGYQAKNLLLSGPLGQIFCTDLEKRLPMFSISLAQNANFIESDACSMEAN